MSQPFPLPPQDVDVAGLDPDKLDRLCALIQRQVDEGLHPGATVAVARHGHLVLDRTFGTPDPAGTLAPDARALWLLYSNTKVIIAATLWQLCENGLIGFGDAVARHLPDFARNGKGEVTLVQLLTHQAGFPNAGVPVAAWEDHEVLRRAVCDFDLEWEPGSRVHYHAVAAHWVAAAVIEAVTGRDFRAVVRDALIAPLGLDDEIVLGVPPDALARTTAMWEPGETGRLQRRERESDPAFKRAGIPAGGGYATARAMAAFYQMLIGGGALAGRRVLAPRTIAFATRDFTGDRADESTGEPMHWGLGPRSRGAAGAASSFGGMAPPGTFGHGGAGSSFCWGDPVSGVSFAFISNARHAEAGHNARMDVLGTLVHAAILDGA